MELQHRERRTFVFGKLLVNILFLVFMLYSVPSYSDTRTDQPGPLFGEIDGTNAGRYRSVKFSNGTTTNNGDGSISVTTGGGGGGGTPGGSNTNVQYNSAGSFAGSNNFVFNGTNVGIGTTLLGTDTFTVKGTGAIVASSIPTMYVRSLNVTDDDTVQSRLAFYSRNDQNVIGTIAGQIRAGVNNIEFRPGSTSTTQMTINETGNVGVGTVLPLGRMQVSTPSTVPFIISTNGNVGIGTMAASGLLHLSGSNAANIRLNNTAASGNTYEIRSSIFNYSNSGFEIFNSTANRNELSIDNSGNVGIGTVTPLGALVVTRGNVGIGTATPLALLSLYNSTSGLVMNLRDKSDPSGPQGLNILLNSKANGTNEDNLATITSTGFSTGALALAVGNTEALRINSSGNIGIGTFSPSASVSIGSGSAGLAQFSSVSLGSGLPDLVVAKTSGVAGIGVFVNDGTNNPRAKFFVDQTNFSWGLKNDFGSFSGAPFIIATGGGASEKMRIDYNGNVGLGTVNPQGRLQVGSIASTPFLIDSSGNVGIGTTAPLSVFQVGPGSGSGNVGIGSVNPTAALDIGGSGNIKVGGLGGSSGDILCRKADKTIGVCATSISGVGCTACN